MSLVKSQVETWNDADGDGIFSRAVVYLGTDDSRQANKLDYKSWNYKLAGNYELGDHLLTVGYELDALDVLTCSSSTLRQKTALTKNATPATPTAVSMRSAKAGRMISTTAMPRPPTIRMTALLIWDYKINTGYLQDEWVTAGGDLTLVFGLRYDWYTSSDATGLQRVLFERQGFANTDNYRRQRTVATTAWFQLDHQRGL